MKWRKGKLSKAQQRIVTNLIYYDNSFIQAIVNDLGCEWDYAFAKPTDMMPLVMKNGVLAKMEGIFEVSRLPYHKNQETIRCLIHKKVLIPTMSDKEFAVQLALGTVDYRIYTLAEEYR